MKKTLRFLAKTLFFLILLSGLYVLIQPEPFLGNISIYNRLIPGRERLPFGESPKTAYNFSLYNLNAMLASHKISGADKDTEDLTVLLIGDSSTWGTLLKPEETVAGQLDGRIVTVDGQSKRLRTYNLGYPTLSLAKDVLLLNRGLEIEPDLILWFTTLEAFPLENQAASPLVSQNLAEFAGLMRQQGQTPDWLNLEPLPLKEKTLFAQRRALMDLVRLQAYGVMWAATGIDQDYPADFPAALRDLDPDPAFYGVTGSYPEELTAWDVLTVGMNLAGTVPVLLVNEPILISTGENAAIRYNFYYPRMAYDSWREALTQRCDQNGWTFMDIWNLLPESAFTNSAIHYNQEGSKLIAEEVLKTLGTLLNTNNND